MKSTDDYMKNWLYFFVFFAWSLFLLFLMLVILYMSFLRPEFGVFLAVAYFIASGYMITAIFRLRTSRMGMSAVARMLVLLLPILYYLAARDTILGSQAFMQRYTGTFDQQRQYPISQDESNNKTDIFPTLEEAMQNSEKFDREETILDIYRKADFYKGKHVSVKGMIMYDDELKQYFGGRNTAVYRFIINCCVADALPLAIAIDSEQTGAFKNDQWVQVEGRFDIQQMADGKRYPIIIQPSINPVDAPSFPYLF